MGSLVFGKYSASRIEQVNAVVVTSAELFPKGSIELYNMKPLGANNIDSTLTAAAAVVCMRIGSYFLYPQYRYRPDGYSV